MRRLPTTTPSSSASRRACSCGRFRAENTASARLRDRTTSPTSRQFRSIVESTRSGSLTTAKPISPDGRRTTPAQRAQALDLGIQRLPPLLAKNLEATQSRHEHWRNAQRPQDRGARRHAGLGDRAARTASTLVRAKHAAAHLESACTRCAERSTSMSVASLRQHIGAIPSSRTGAWRRRGTIVCSSSLTRDAT